MQTLSVFFLLATVCTPWLQAAPSGAKPADGAKGASLLMIAAAKGDLPELKRLIDAGADVNSRTADRGPTGAYVGGWTPLLLAAREGQVQAVELLLSKGAQLNAHTANGQTCLSVALFQTNTTRGRAIVKLLLAKGAAPNELTGHGERPLHIAALQGETESARLLLEAGAKVDGLARADHATPLMNAAACGQPEVARLLLEHGANPNAHNDAGLTVTDFARRNQHLEVIDLLKKLR